MKTAATACFPLRNMDEVTRFAKVGDMVPLRLKMASVPFRDLRHYATDLLVAIFSRSLIAYELTWPSPQ